MQNNLKSPVQFLAATTALLLIAAAGCNSNSPSAARQPGDTSDENTSTLLPANATAEQVFQAKCNCHGANGAGGKGPSLAGLSNRADSQLFQIVHDGRDRMPAFGGKLTDDQITAVVTYIKEFATKGD